MAICTASGRKRVDETRHAPPGEQRKPDLGMGRTGIVVKPVGRDRADSVAQSLDLADRVAQRDDDTVDLR
mgnify:CR=1 FL=1